MRIISGLNKGKKLIMPNDKKTRPLKDMAKESIFNILTHANYINFHLEDSKVLDLFSGIGSFGLECISRGSKFVFLLSKHLSNFNFKKTSKKVGKSRFLSSQNPPQILPRPLPNPSKWSQNPTHEPPRPLLESIQNTSTKK